MAKTVTHTVNFGSAKGGLSTVGYTIYNTDGTVKQTRSTAGVAEIGTSTGIYAALISFSEGDNVIVLWDTGEATPRYAAEEYRTQLNTIQEETDHIRLIWNSMRNQGDFYSKVADKMDKLKAIIDTIGEIVTGISKKENITASDIKKILTITVLPPVVNLPAPVVNIPETKIPDYTVDISKINEEIMKIKEEVKQIPKKQKEYDVNFNNLIGLLSEVQKKIADDNASNYGRLSSNIDNLKNIFSQLNVVISKMNDLHRKLMSLDENDKGILKSKQGIMDEIKRLNMFIYNITSSVAFREAQDINKALMAFGHKR